MVDISLYNDDCFNVLPTLDKESIDLILIDPPYGTTTINWDKTFDFNKMWEKIDYIAKPNANIIIFGSQPFTSLMITSKLEWFKYELIWNKNKCGSPGLAHYRPQKVHENIMLFSKGKGVYNPIMEKDLLTILSVQLCEVSDLPPNSLKRKFNIDHLCFEDELALKGEL